MDHDDHSVWEEVPSIMESCPLDVALDKRVEGRGGAGFVFVEHHCCMVKKEWM
jgi:hypothetical protein